MVTALCCAKVSVVLRICYRRLRLVLEAVADASHGLYSRLLELRGGELSAQAGHVNVHRPGLDEAVSAPDDVQQLLTPEHATGSPDQGGQELKLLRRQLDLAPLHPDLEAVAVDLEIADLEAGLLLLGVGRAAPAEHGADPGDQLAWRERLGHVVIGPDLEAENLVALLHSPADHDDGDLRQIWILLQPPAHLPAIQLRDHDVEQEHVGSVLSRKPERLVSVGAEDHVVPLFPEV